MEPRKKLILFYSKFVINRAKFLVSTCTSFLCTAPQYSEITGTFLRVQTEEQVLRIIKSKITVEKTFNGDQFGDQGKHG